MYSDAQKGILPIVSVFCGVILALLYRYVKRPLYGNNTFEKRMNYLYTFTSAALFGEVMFQSYPNATIPMIVHDTNTTTISTALSPAIGSSIPSLFFAVGFFLISTFYESLRIWHENPYLVTNESNTSEVLYNVDPETSQMAEYFEADNTAPDLDTSQQRYRTIQDRIITQKRRYMAIVTILIMTVTCILEGFFLSYQSGNKWVIVVVYMIDKMMETVVVGVSMANALFHTTTENQYNWYFIASLFWCLVVVCSTIPVLASMTMTTAASIVSHMAVGIFYAMAGACLFFICFIYTNIHLCKTDKTETLIRQVIWAATAAMAWIVGYFY